MPPCIYLDKEREVSVAIEMCVQYLESSVDSIVIRDNEFSPIGIVGDYDLLNHINKDPTRGSQFETKVKYIMSKDLLIVEKDTTYKNLMEKWTSSRRSFAIIPNALQGSLQFLQGRCWMLE